MPYDYAERQFWAEKKMRTHKQVRCPECGLFEIWVKK
jgi:hypothetical protein